MPLDEPFTDVEVAELEADIEQALRKAEEAKRELARLEELEELAKRDKRAEETMRQILIERYGEEEARKQSPHVWRD